MGPLFRRDTGLNHTRVPSGQKPTINSNMESMTEEPKRPVGRPPGKTFPTFFITPITEEMARQLNDVKFNFRIDKTEFGRRLFQYFLDLPQDSQLQIIKSFDFYRQREAGSRARRRKMTYDAMPKGKPGRKPRFQKPVHNTADHLERSPVSYVPPEKEEVRGPSLPPSPKPLLRSEDIPLKPQFRKQAATPPTPSKMTSGLP